MLNVTVYMFRSTLSRLSLQQLELSYPTVYFPAQVLNLRTVDMESDRSSGVMDNRLQVELNKDT